MKLSKKKIINVCEPLLTPNAEKYVMDCIKTEWISSAGKYLENFEKNWAKYCGANDGISVTNGTSALQVAFKSLDLKPGDEVIMPSFTIISCATAVIEAGGIPVLVDCYKDNWCINVEDLKKKITKKTKAILVVHMFGHPADMKPIQNIARQNKLYLIEDAAEAHGATYYKKRVGSFGDLACFSFYANKLITTGEGGMVLSNNAKLTDKIRSLRNLSFRPDRRFYHTEIGYNYRLTNMQAALGISQIENLEEHIRIKRQNTFLYNKILSKMNLPLQLPSERDNCKSVFWMYGVIIQNKIFDAKYLADKLLERGVETRPLFLGMHQQPVLKKLNLFKKERFSVTENLAKYGLYLPSGLKLTENKIKKVCNILQKIFDEKFK